MKIKQITILQLLKNKIERVVSPALSEVETHLFSNFSKTLLILLLVNLLLIVVHALEISLQYPHEILTSKIGNEQQTE